jgi:hypothetical protein
MIVLWALAVPAVGVAVLTAAEMALAVAEWVRG